MKLSDGYYADLVLATLFRVGFTLGILCIIAVVSSGCSRTTPTEPVSLDAGAVRRQLDDGEAAQTRNRLPQGGCDEKSDSSLTGPLRRLEEVKP
jgi:hypothetical protein